MDGNTGIESLDRDAFDALMAQLDPPLAIVTTASQDVRAGCVVGFHAQCGIDPLSYAVWLSKANHTYRVGALSETFAVHFLSRDDHDLAELFGGHTQEDIDKFEHCDWTPGPDGVPLLDRIANRFVGRRDSWLDANTDHVCLILDPIDVRKGGDDVSSFRVSDASDIQAAHQAEERQRPD